MARRFSREQEDTAGLFKRLTFAGVNIVDVPYEITVSDPTTWTRPYHHVVRGILAGARSS